MALYVLALLLVLALLPLALARAQARARALALAQARALALALPLPLPLPFALPFALALVLAFFFAQQPSPHLLELSWTTRNGAHGPTWPSAHVSASRKLCNYHHRQPRVHPSARKRRRRRESRRHMVRAGALSGASSPRVAVGKT